MRRIGVLMTRLPDDPEGRPASRRFGRRCSNWAGPTAATCGSTLAGRQATPDDIRKYAAELVALAPDVILATGSAGRGRHCKQATRTVPIVFVNVIDPVGAGFVESSGAAGRQRHRLQLHSNTASARNGWSCSRRSRPA